MPTAYGRIVRPKKLTDFLPVRTRSGYQPGQSANPGAPIKRPKARTVPTKRGGGSRRYF